MTMKNTLLILLGISICSANTALAISIDTDHYDLNEFSTILEGGVINISSMSYLDGNNTPNNIAGAVGTFSGATPLSGLDFSSGVLLTTGSSGDIDGSMNLDDYTSTSNRNAGNNLLTGLSQVPFMGTFDASILEFTFSSSANGTVSFNYNLGSEHDKSEHSDVFGVWVDNKLDPQAINNFTTNDVINNNPDIKLNTYLDDPITGLPTPSAYQLEYDILLTNQSVDIFVAANIDYTVRFAIADASNYIGDSGVFISSATFTPTPEPMTMLLFGTGLAGLTATRLRRKHRRQLK